MNRWSKLFGKNTKDGASPSTPISPTELGVELDAAVKPVLPPIEVDATEIDAEELVNSTPVRELSKFTKCISDAKDLASAIPVTGASLGSKARSIARASSAAVQFETACSSKAELSVKGATAKQPPRELIKRMSNLVRSSSTLFLDDTDADSVTSEASSVPSINRNSFSGLNISGVHSVIPSSSPPSSSSSSSPSSYLAFPSVFSVDHPLIRSLSQLNKELEIQIARAESKLSQSVLGEVVADDVAAEEISRLTVHVATLKKTLKATKEMVGAAQIAPATA
jgi:hypothetical protein